MSGSASMQVRAPGIAQSAPPTTPASALVRNAVVVDAREPGTTVLYRVLWAPGDDDHLVWIRLVDPAAWPVWVPRAEVLDRLAAATSWVQTADPYAALVRPEHDLTDAAKDVRERRWAVIRNLVTDTGHRLFYSADGGRLIAAAAERARASRATVYRYLRWYWQRGQSPNALLPDFGRCGAPGRDRTARAAPDAPKLGLPNRLEREQGERIIRNVSPEWRRLIVAGARQFAEKQQLSLPKAYDATIGEYFSDRVVGEDGKLRRVAWPRDRRPTAHQFRYWYEHDRHPVESRIRREGLNRFLRERRGVLGTTRDMAVGPGSLYQVDATLADLYLLSRLVTNRVIGRPVTYFVLDHFSDIIVGYYAGLEGPSWLGMMLALEHAFTDKVAACARYGITIGPDDWPCHHIPNAMLGDRGELLSKHADELANGFQTTVQNTAPRRPDWKALVEGNFGIFDVEAVHRWVPGEVHPAREPGDPDYRLDAKFNLYDYNRLIIEFILYANHHRRLRRALPEGFVPDDYADPTPMDLWRWGLVHRSGHLRVMAPDAVRAHLLPSAEARVDRHGIHLNGLRYDADVGHREGWFVDDDRGSFYVDGAYDPRDVAIAFLRPQGAPPEPLRLIGDDAALAGRTLEEVQDERAFRRRGNLLGEPQRLQARLDFREKVRAIVDEATERQEAVAQQTQGRVTTKELREHRAAERLAERRAGVAVQGDTVPADPLGAPLLPHAEDEATAILGAPEREVDGYVAPASHAALLRSVRARRNDT